MTTHVPQPVPAAFDAQAQPQAQPAPQLQIPLPDPVRIPEGGYASRFTKIPLPDFTIPGVPEPWVEIRNPGLMSQDALEEIATGVAQAQAAVGESGIPDSAAVYGQLLKLIRSWCMWDAQSNDDIPPLLPDPTDVPTLRRAPVGALKRVFKAFEELANPQ